MSPPLPPPPPPTVWSNRRSAEAAASVPVDSPYHLRMVDGVTDRSKPLHPVLEVLKARLAVGSKPGARADGFKVGLAIEGGGMRGVLSAGMAAALKYVGLQDAIDVVYGSSAGSIIGAYFVSGQVPLYGASIYYDSICSDRFISKRALLSSPYLLGRSGRAVTDTAGNKVRPVLYLDALLDEVMKETKPLDWNAFVKHSAKQPLKPVASSLTAMRSEILDGFSTLDELLDCLRASARVPGIAGDPVAINGAFYSDAMIFEPVPFRSALADGCTHVLVLRTKPETSRLPSRPGIYEALIAAPYFNRNPDSPCPAAARFVLDGKHIGIYKEVVEDLRRRRSGWVDPAAAAASGGGWVLDVVPAWDSKEVAQLETRPRIIYNGARNGFAAAYEALSPFATPSAEVYGTSGDRGEKGKAAGAAARPPALSPPRRGRRARTPPPPPSAIPPPSRGAASAGSADGQAVAATATAAAAAAPPATGSPPRVAGTRRKADAFGAPTERLRAGDVVARFVFREDVLEAQLARASSASAADAAVPPGLLAKLAARRRRRSRGATAAAATAEALAAHAASSGGAPPPPQGGATGMTAAAGGGGGIAATASSAAPTLAATPAAAAHGGGVGGGLSGVVVDGTASAASPIAGRPPAGALVVVDAHGAAAVAPRDDAAAGGPRRRQGLYQRIQAGRERKRRKRQQQQQQRRVRSRKA